MQPVYANDFFFKLIGMGMVLRIPHKGKKRCSLVSTKYGTLPEIEVSTQDAERYSSSSLMHKLTRESDSSRAGYLELGLDGEAADFYCMTV
jgi:hypothetical protein